MALTYLDCNATTPVDERVAELVMRYFGEEFGNSGSRTHEFGTVAKRAVQAARNQLADVAESKPDEVIFTSGATESNNLALLGLEAAGKELGRKHLITTAIEHKAVLEPLEELATRGFELSVVGVSGSGAVDPEEIQSALRPDTLLVSVMQANNETGVRQPIAGVSRVLADHEAFFHVDAAQGFAKDIDTLRDPRIDLISLSGHKIFGPKGVGALIARRRGFSRLPLRPLSFGGGQEKGLRPGTLPVPLIAGLGLAAELACKEAGDRRARCAAYRKSVLEAFVTLGAQINGDGEQMMPHVVNLSIPGVDSEALIVSLKDLIAISNGSACTSSSYEPSHVLTAMGLSEERIQGAIRISWSHLTEDADWQEVVSRIAGLR